MSIDDRAFQLAYKAFDEAPMGGNADETGLRAGIEAYEAAKAEEQPVDIKALEQNLESMRQTNAALVKRLQERESVSLHQIERTIKDYIGTREVAPSGIASVAANAVYEKYNISLIEGRQS